MQHKDIEVVEGGHVIRFNIGNTLYILALVICIGAHIFDASTAVEYATLDLLATVLKWISVGLFAIRGVLLLKKNNIEYKKDKHSILLVGSLFIASIISFLCSGEKGMFMMAILIAGSYGVSYQNTVRTIRTTLIVGVLLVIIASILGLIDLNTVAGDLSESGDRVQRYALGFNHPNALGMMLILILLCSLIINNLRLSTVESTVWAGIVLILISIVKTRTSALVIVFGILLSCTLRLIKRNKPDIDPTLILTVLSVSFALGGLLLVLIYGAFPNQLSSLDELLSNRLSYASDFIANYPITPFGQHVEQIGTIEAFRQNVNPLVLDNAYYHLLICQGAIPFVLTVGAYMCAFRKVDINENGLGQQASICLLALVGISETLPITVLGCIPLLSLLAREESVEYDRAA